MSLVEPLFEQAAKCRIVLQESIDEIVILAERDELEGGCAVDRDNHWLVVAETPVMAQMALASLRGMIFMVFAELLASDDQRVSRFSPTSTT